MLITKGYRVIWSLVFRRLKILILYCFFERSHGIYQCIDSSLLKIESNFKSDPKYVCDYAGSKRDSSSVTLLYCDTKALRLKVRTKTVAFEIFMEIFFSVQSPKVDRNDIDVNKRDEPNLISEHYFFVITRSNMAYPLSCIFKLLCRVKNISK